jgi:hypothetical protein
MGPLMAAAQPDTFTLIDLRPLRPLVFGQRHKALDADLVRTIHEFDALLLLTGSTASANLSPRVSYAPGGQLRPCWVN